MPPSAPVLSPRQAEVLALLERGLYYKEIASALGISINTVGKHAGKIYRKTGATGKCEALWRLQAG